MKNEVDRDLHSQTRMCILAPEANAMEGRVGGWEAVIVLSYGQVKTGP